MNDLASPRPPARRQDLPSRRAAAPSGFTPLRAARLRAMPIVLLAILAIPVAAANTASLQVRQATEDWDGARKRVNEDEAWRQWLQQESQRLAAWKSQERDRDDLEAGWLHDLQDDATGAFRAAAADAGCDRSETNAGRRAACVAQMRHRHIRMTQTAARIAVLTGSAHAASWAGAQLDMYARLLARGAGPGAAVLFRQGLDEANAVPLLADTVRLLRRSAPPEQARAWCAGVLLPIGKRLMASQKEVHNISVWYSAAAAVAAMECDDQELLGQVQQGPWSLARLLQAGTSADGFWFELSLGYQNYVVQAVHEVLLAAALRGKGGIWEPLYPFVLSLLASPLRVQFHGGDGPTINDSNRHPRIPDIALLNRVSRTLPTAAGTAAAQADMGWDSLLDPLRSGPPLGVAPADGGEQISGLKSLLLRDQGWQAFLRAGQGARHHAHQDILSLELKHGDTWIFRHSATPAYGSPLHRGYYKRALAHNTPLVGGDGISNWFAHAAALEADEHSVGATFKSFRHGLAVQRQLQTSGDIFTDRLRFDGAPASGATLGAIYHTDCRLAAPSVPSEPAPLPTGPAFAQLQALSSWRADGNWTARLECGPRSFVLRVSAPQAFTVTQLSAPALAPARRRTALLLDLPGGGASWLTLQLEATPAAGGTR